MARPLKQTVDYFPHYSDASERMTLFTLLNKYGNEGYAFWFRLLELLARTEGHALPISTPTQWQYLLGHTGVTDDTAHDILQTLVDLDAIDPELAAVKIIWCANLVSNVADAYKRRQVMLPERPDGLKPNGGIEVRRIPKVESEPRRPTPPTPRPAPARPRQEQPNRDFEPLCPDQTPEEFEATHPGRKWVPPMTREEIAASNEKRWQFRPLE